MNEKLRQAIQLSKSGQKQEAQVLLRELVDADPEMLTAWFWLADAMQSDEERLTVLEEAVFHHPTDERLRGALEKLSANLSSVQTDEKMEPVEEQELEDQLSVDSEMIAAPEEEYDFVVDEEEQQQDMIPSREFSSPRRQSRKTSPLFFALFIVSIVLLAAVWFFRDSLTALLPQDFSPSETAVVTDTAAAVSELATATLQMTPVPTEEPTQTETPVQTEVVGSVASTATPILMTTPSNTPVVVEGKFLTLRGSQINDMAWSSEGAYFAVAGDEGITIYNGETFTEKIHIALDPVVAVRALSFSADEKYIAAGFDQTNSGEELITRAKLWQVNDGAEVMSFDYNAPRGDIDQIAFSADGEILLMNAQLDVVLKWRVNDGALLDVFTLSASEVDYFDVVFAPDRLSFATISRFDRVRLYDTVTGEQITVLGSGEDTKAVQAAVFSSSSQYLAVQFEEQPVVYLWDLPAREKIREWNTFGGNVTTLAFDADNQTLAVGTDEDLIKFYQIRTGEEQRVISRQIPSVIEMEFAPDDILFAVRNETEIQVWHLLTDTLVATFRVTD